MGFASRVGSRIIPNQPWTCDVTHVISRVKSDHLASRSLKYMHGILCGAWIVSWDWVEASMKVGRWVEETKYEIVGDASKGVSHTPAKMRKRLAGGGKRLFHNMKLCVYHDMVAGRDPSVAEVQKLILSGDGIGIPLPKSAVLTNGNGFITDKRGTSPTSPPTSNGAIQPLSVNGTGGAISPPSSSLLAQAGVIRRLSSNSGISLMAATIPGPTYLLMRGDAHKVYSTKEMEAIGAEVRTNQQAQSDWLAPNTFASHLCSFLSPSSLRAIFFFVCISLVWCLFLFLGYLIVSVSVRFNQSNYFGVT